MEIQEKQTGIPSFMKENYFSNVGKDTFACQIFQPKTINIYVITCLWKIILEKLWRFKSMVTEHARVI